MKKEKKKHIETVDELDKELMEMFSQVRAVADARNEATGDEFVGRVMDSLPRRDISLWVVGLSIMLGMVVVVLIMGLEVLMEFMEELGGFFMSICSFSVPTMESVMCVIGVTVVMYIVCVSILSTEDYMLEE
ncbi:MAG: hypothetical protein IIY15_02940 [Flavobacteriales bacterium]|nr:hypothetical protein [Flavobacteriales bacterium]